MGFAHSSKTLYNLCNHPATKIYLASQSHVVLTLIPWIHIVKKLGYIIAFAFLSFNQVEYLLCYSCIALLSYGDSKCRLFIFTHFIFCRTLLFLLSTLALMCSMRWILPFFFFGIPDTYFSLWYQLLKRVINSSTYK
jgi:hypothetical protein